MIKYASLFSGIGGFELGIQQAAAKLNINTECVFASEIDKHAQSVYKEHFGDEVLHGDITKINETDIPNIDFLCGGFPCQSFSIAGKRRGFEDTKGTLFFEIARIVKAKRPKMLFLENVKGLLNHDEGRTFGTILDTLGDLGYDVEWECINSKNYGVPQSRDRVFIIGHLRGFCPRGSTIFPIREIPSICSKSRKNKQEVREVASTLTARQYGSWNGNFVKAVLTPNRKEKRQNGRRFKNHNEEMFTLTAQDKHGVLIGNQIRQLTPIECERLQGFPDNWTNCVSDSQRYKQTGNAVTVNVIEAIATKLLINLNKNKENQFE